MLIISQNKTAQLTLLIISLLFFYPAQADVVKPALVEISVNQAGQIHIEARVSIEALLTGINSKYKNTQEAPTAAEYDVLRKLNAPELKQEFKAFEQQFLDEISLKTLAGEELNLAILDVDIPEPGYTKVPRISLVTLTGNITKGESAVIWYYPKTNGDNAVRLRQVDKNAKQYHWSEWQWLRKDKSSKPFSLTEVFTKKPLYQVVQEYIVLGFAHILPKGLDHILFILGLFLFSIQFKPLFWQITMFTIAHTLTLGLSINGVINVPENIVEPLIALSIAYIGIENVLSSHLKNSRLFLVFVFGLLHGLGFAGVLAEFGLPSNDFIAALLSFNLGVELGQLAVLLLVFLLVGYWFRDKAWYRASITTPASLIIAMIGLYWFIQRLDLNLS